MGPGQRHPGEAPFHMPDVDLDSTLGAIMSDHVISLSWLRETGDVKANSKMVQCNQYERADTLP